MLTSGWEGYRETVEVMYSATDDNPDGFFVMVDDIACEPVAEGFAIRGYAILSDGVTVGENVGARGSWTDAYVLPESGAIYNVVPVVEEYGRIFRGSKSNDAVALTSGVSDIALEEVTVRGMISVSGCEGLDMRVYSVDGLTAAAINDAADYEALQLQPGVYIVSIGLRSWRVLVK